ncbi:MFS transporter [Gulosibacter sp. 10]|uniref:MFS transporter n=1 Tax=Gulosibacter sp. 10 TaxID=1255570 RepID=UPI00097EA33C|nr:MFS transporter [Gulosibacter sp. 10]SJM63994.1 Putative transport protein [Gulosibacter sp. 10]
MSTTSDAGAAQQSDRGWFRRLRKPILSGWAGTTLEFFDFQIYALAAALVFNRIFFPELDPALGMLSSFGTYAVGFFARPIGAIFFGWLGDKKGRKLVLVVTIGMMGVSTMLIGLLPDYHQVGILAPILLLLLRVVQGLGAGAELAGATVFLAEFAPKRKRGIVSAFVALGTNSGTLLASFTWLLLAMMPEDMLLSWGWRIPFVASILVTLFTLYIRRHLDETPVFKSIEEQEAVKQIEAETAARAEQIEEARKPLGEILRKGWKTFLLAMMLRIGESGTTYLYQTFLVGYIATTLLMDRSIASAGVMVASLLGFITVPLFGLLADKYGRRIIYRYVSLFQALFAFPALAFLQTTSVASVMLALIGGMSIGMLGMYAVQSSYLPEMFGSRYRYTGLAAAKEIGALVSGGIAPVVATGLLAWFSNSWIPIAVYISVLALIAFVATFIAPETVGRDLTRESDAVDDPDYAGRSSAEVLAELDQPIPTPEGGHR